MISAKRVDGWEKDRYFLWRGPSFATAFVETGRRTFGRVQGSYPEIASNAHLGGRSGCEGAELPELICGTLSNGARLTCGGGVLGWRVLMDCDYLTDGQMTVQAP
jgi:hypothetical protein